MTQPRARYGSEGEIQGYETRSISRGRWLCRVCVYDARHQSVGVARRDAAIDYDFRAGDIARLIAGEEGD